MSSPSASTAAASPWPARIACAVVAMLGFVLAYEYFGQLAASGPPPAWMVAPLVLSPAALALPMFAAGWLEADRVGRAPGRPIAAATALAPLAAFIVWPIATLVGTTRALADEDHRFRSLLVHPEVAALASEPPDELTVPPDDAAPPAWIRAARVRVLEGRGVLVGGRDGALHVDRLQLALPDDLRARSLEDASWIAIVHREVIEDAYEWVHSGTGTPIEPHPDVEHVEIDVRTPELERVARIAVGAVPPGDVLFADMWQRYDLPDAWCGEHVAEALRGRIGELLVAPAE